MKRIKCIIVVAALMLCIGVTSVSAQREPDFFVVNYTVVRVFDSPYGYRLVIRGGDLVERYFFVPTDWVFLDKVALVSFAYSTTAPYLQAYFDSDSGELSFFRLVLPRNPNHPVWEYYFRGDLAPRFEAAQLSDLQAENINRLELVPSGDL